MNPALHVLAWLTVVLCFYVSAAAHRNARYCTLNSHEDIYSVMLGIAGLVLTTLLIASCTSP